MAWGAGGLPLHALDEPTLCGRGGGSQKIRHYIESQAETVFSFTGIAYAQNTLRDYYNYIYPIIVKHALFYAFI